DASVGDTVKVGINLMSALIVGEEIVEPTREDSSDSFGTRDGIARSFEDMPIDLGDASQLEADQLIASGDRAKMAERIYSLRLENLKVHAMLDIEMDRVNNLHLYMSLSHEEFCQIRKDRDDARGRLRRTMTITRSGMTLEVIEELVNRCVEEALAAHEATRAANALKTKNQSQNGSDGDSGNGNGRNENPYENVRGDKPIARECTNHDFMKCQPISLKGTEGVVGLIRWFEKMETVFHISNCPEKSQIKYATCTLLDSALTWNEIQKMETELWNLTVKNNDLTAYTHRFQELTMKCTKMVPEEEDRVEKFIGGLPNNIQGNVIATEPTRLQDANIGGQNVARAYVAGNNEKKEYEGTLPFCNKCKLHHVGPCTIRCGKCNKIRNLTRDYKVTNSTTTTQRGQMVNQRDVTCFECGAPGHFRKDCPKVKNQNIGNKTRVPEPSGKSYVLGGGDAYPGSNTVTGTFLLNDHHAYMLFDSGVDRSFVSNTFSALLDITPFALNVSYAVELADERTSETNTVLRGCTLGLLGHPFNINLTPIELGSFDVIIGMDWLAKNHAVIVYDEKIVHIPYGNKILIVQGDKSDKEKKSTLSIISCVKAQKYIEERLS
ncbi:putative reverse transcriptase domain-containing protein, partial [Tanacetum coccineum]